MEYNEINNNAPLKSETYRLTSDTLNELVAKDPYYSGILDSFNNGSGKLELRKRFVIKMIDEVWIKAVEDTLSSIDTIIRTPGLLLQENEAVLPVEQTRRVTSRSVQHLSQHTDLINEIRKDGTIVPSKVLNVFQDETILTYENKFINTLLSRLYAFVEKRYDSASECGEDEKNTVLDYTQTFEREEQHGKIHLTVEISEKPGEHEKVKNYIYTTDLWRRVLRIRRIVGSYMGSDFVREMGRNYIRPPVMRTNKLLKNVEFRQCLALWEFFDQYDNTGYELIVQEDLEKVDEKCIDEIYRTVAMQYVIFRSNITSEFEDDKILAMSDNDKIYRPKMVDELEELKDSDFDQKVKVEPSDNIVPVVKDDEDLKKDAEEYEAKLEEAIKTALIVDSYFPVAEETERPDIVFQYRFSFKARLIQSGDPLQKYYGAVKNRLLSYEKVKSNLTWDYDSFRYGRGCCAKLKGRGKNLWLYLSISPDELAGTKFKVQNVGTSKATRTTPTLFKITSGRALKTAIELIDFAMEKLGAKLGKMQNVDYSMPYMSTEDMLNLDPPLVKNADKII